MYPRATLHTASRLGRSTWIAVFLVVLAVQATATYLSLKYTFDVVVRLLNSGGAASVGDSLVSLIYSVLAFPIFPLLDHLRAGGDWFPGVWQPVPFVLNGIVWASAVCILVRWALSRRTSGQEDNDG